MTIRYLLPIALVLASFGTVQAGEACRSAKDMIRMVNAFYAADAERVNIVEPTVSLAFSPLNGHPVPTQMLFRHKAQSIYLDINSDGYLQGIETLVGFSKDGEMCRVDEGQVPDDVEGDTTSVNVSFSFNYRRKDGDFSIDEILEGAKDGSKVMAGVAPGGLGFVVPGLKAVTLEPALEGGPIPTYTFTRNGKVVEVPSSVFDTTRYFRTKAIKASKADRLTIASDYVLNAGFKFDPDDIEEAETKRLAKLAVSASTDSTK